MQRLNALLHAFKGKCDMHQFYAAVLTCFDEYETKNIHVDILNNNNKQKQKQLNRIMQYTINTKQNGRI